MPPSQLKALKAKLREQGIVGPQQSKKQRKQNAQNGGNKDKRFSRKDALDGIREQFNPFEFQKAGGKAPKFEVTSIEGRKPKGILRPGVKKSMDQEIRNKSITEEHYNRNKVGGVIDRRFGENDPTMAPEDKMLERYTRAQMKGRGKGSAFDLEDDDMSGELTHMGKSLSFDGPALRDDFEDDDVALSDADEDRSARKRRRSDVEGDEEEGEEGSEQEDKPERKKSKQEVMKEVIAKSKLHKYERQAAKDDDDDLREELDKEMSSINALLRGLGPKPPPAAAAGQAGMNPDRLALLNGVDKARIEKEYDLRLRQLAQDERSKPTEKSKTEEQMIEERARKLQDLEAKKQRRMQGAPESGDEEEVDGPVEGGDDIEDQADEFGLGKGIRTRPTMAELGLEDEDDFVIDDDLVASGSEVDDSDAEPTEEDSDEEGQDEEDEEDGDFLQGILSKDDQSRPEFLTGANGPIQEVEDLAKNGVNGDLAFTFECPQSHEELLTILEKVVITDLPLAIQRIRTIYDPKLKSENKGRLGKFAAALVDHISHLANQDTKPHFAILETVIRHIHSLAKTYGPEIANAFRRHLNAIRESRSLVLTPGDLVLFTAVGTIFPTSDHFHQVITPTTLTMARYLGLKIPQMLSDYATGTYLSMLCIDYQRMSKRYVPEVMNFLENSLCVFSPKSITKPPGNFPYHEPKASMRISGSAKSARKIQFADCMPRGHSEAEQEEIRVAILEATLQLLSITVETWSNSAAFVEIFTPVSQILQHLGSKACKSKLPASTQTLVTTLTETIQTTLTTSLHTRAPLTLHHHRPLAIKTHIPKFEESFNPDRHYDPDKTRTESAKLAKEYKREHKGAMRSLRKDAKIDAVRALKDKREKDERYEKGQRRLLAMIQGEEGGEKNKYEREREWRRKSKK